MENVLVPAPDSAWPGPLWWPPRETCGPAASAPTWVMLDCGAFTQPVLQQGQHCLARALGRSIRLITSTQLAPPAARSQVHPLLPLPIN